MARNGYLAEDGLKLVTVEDDDRLIATSAAAFLAAKAAAARDGVGLWIVEPAGAYRPYSTQYGMYYHPEQYNLNPKNSLKGAAPGYSTHGWGNRVDVNAAGLAWMIANGHKFGWTREFGSADPNHFKHDGRTAIATAFTLLSSVQIGDVEMRVIYNEDAPESADATRRAIVGELSFQVITGPQSKRERKLWGDPVNFTVGEWNACRDIVILRRKELGLPVVVTANGSVGVSKADLDAAVSDVKASIATVNANIDGQGYTVTPT
jgi:hypothetical protein